MLERIDQASLHYSPPSPSGSELAWTLVHANLTRLRLLAWVLVATMPVLIAVDAWVLHRFDSPELAEVWEEELAMRIAWMASGGAFLLAGRSPATPGEMGTRHRLAETLFVPLWLAMAGVHNGIGASSGSNISVYLLALFTMSAFLYLDGRRKLLVYGLGWVVLIASMVHLHSAHGTRVGPDVVNGTLMTLLAVVVSRVTYATRAREHASQRLIARQKAELERANAELAASNTALQRVSLLDHLTGVPNRRYFEEHLSREWRRAAREGAAISLIMIDVDYFKGFNDRYGHRDGDACLVKIAAAVQGALRRPGDMLARYGGDEFAVVLPNTGLGGALHVAERVHRAVADLDIHHSGSALGRVTISQGVASWQPGVQSPVDRLVSAADEALYRAKREGRNAISSGARG